VPTVTKGRVLATVVLASLMPAGCILQENSGGYAAGGSGAVAGDGHDGGAADAQDEGAGDGPDDPGADLPADGEDASGGDGDGGGGSDGAGGAAMHCSALPFGCVCAPLEPSQVGACNTGSVIKMPGQRSVCCNNPYNCICVAYECVRISGSNCSCQLAAASLAGTRVDDCGAVTGNPAIKCCRSYGQCICSTMDCLPIETQVPNCNIQDLLACDVGSESVSRCEEAGAG
jgi:hypothetical protein